MKQTVLLLTMLFSLVTNAVVLRDPKIIYGVDNRKDIYEVTNAIQLEASKSTAAQINPANLTLRPDGFVEVGGGTLQSNGMCLSEKFINQTTAARCSGFLVGPDLLATAGHCVKTMSDCSNYAWVFDYKIDKIGQNKAVVPGNSIYRCAGIVATVMDNTKNDFAIIKLNRMVSNRAPLKVRRLGIPSVGGSLFVIGAPTGLPLKVADGAKIRKVGPVFLTANLDTYGGNSGSPVFNNAGEVEGILVRGDTDYVYDSVKQCSISNIVPENGGSGEEVTLTKNFLRYISAQ